VSGTPVRRYLLEWHKSLGMTLLALSGFRIAHRMVTTAPPYAERLGRLTHLGASGAHLALYGLMLFMPLTGYVVALRNGAVIWHRFVKPIVCWPGCGQASGGGPGMPERRADRTGLTAGTAAHHSSSAAPRSR